LLAIARARFERNQLLDPAGDSTRDYVERALALDAENQDALAVRAELAAAVTDSARLVLESGDLEGATALANEARRLGAPSETLALLDLDLAAAREAAARRAQGQLLALGLERMRQDRLVAPEDDSALFYLGRLNDENADYPGFASAWGELSVLLTDRIETAISTQDWEGAESWIAALASVADGTAVEAQRRELAAARLQAEYLAKPAAAGELRIATTGQLEYPADALRLEIDGWVYVEFIVGVDGVPRDARILDASPRNRFEEAALSAVSLYRYVPFERDGRVYERLARLRIRFDLQ
jgi:TonB family protein